MKPPGPIRSPKPGFGSGAAFGAGLGSAGRVARGGSNAATAKPRIGVPRAVGDFLHAELVSSAFRNADHPAHGASGAIRSVGVSKSVGRYELPESGFQSPRPCGLRIAPRRLFHNGSRCADLEP